MIRLRISPVNTIEQARAMLQQAINLEFGTLPPYLYALLSLHPDTNAQARSRLLAITHQEMIHLCLGANILNALGGRPRLQPPSYPGPLPGDIGSDGKVLTVHLFPFGEAAMKQGMAIEMPVDPLEFKQLMLAAGDDASQVVTIGEFYEHLDRYLGGLPPQSWSANRNQITGKQFFPGQLFAVNGYDDAHKAIQVIVSEGEGAADSPLDFSRELAHYYRFEELYRNQVLTSSDAKEGFSWGAPLGVDWREVYPAIADPQTHDFSGEPEAAQQAQRECTRAYSGMVDALNAAFDGNSAQLGIAVRYMFDLRMAAITALSTPLNDRSKVAGPAFTYKQF